MLIFLISGIKGSLLEALANTGSLYHGQPAVQVWRPTGGLSWRHVQTNGQSSSDDSSRAIYSYAELVTTITVVLSVQTSVNLSVLKPWGLHPLDDLATITEVLEQFKRGEIEGCSSFVFPDTLLEQPFECYITPNLSGPFHTVFRCARVREIHVFSRYLASGRFFKNRFLFS